MTPRPHDEAEAGSAATPSDLADAHREILSLRAQIDELRWIESALRERTRELSERVKELDCLYAISDCIGSATQPLDDILQAIADVLPSGFQFPACTSIALNVCGHRYCSAGFRPGNKPHSVSISSQGRCIGAIELCLSEPPMLTYKPPLLPEEKHLLHAVATWLGEIVEHRSGTDAQGMPNPRRPSYALFARR